MELSEKSSTELLSNLKKMRALETNNTADILIHLREVQLRKLALERGFPSLYDFCLEELGYHKDEAYARICGVQCLIVWPEIEAHLRANKISLTSLKIAHVTFNRENKARKKSDSPRLSDSEKIAALKAIANGSTRSAERILAELFPGAEDQGERTKPVAGDRVQISFSASAELNAKFERIKNHQGHKNYSREWESMFEELANAYLANLDREQAAPTNRTVKKKRARGSDSHVAAQTDVPAASDRHASATTRKPSEPTLQQSASTQQQTTAHPTGPSPVVSIAATSTRPIVEIKVSEFEYQQVIDFDAAATTAGKNSRYWSADNRREIRSRANGQCEYVDAETGRRCTSRHALEQDEIRPIAFGGTNDINNLRLLCAQHNKFTAWKAGIGWKREGARLDS